MTSWPTVATGRKPKSPTSFYARAATDHALAFMPAAGGRVSYYLPQY